MSYYYDEGFKSSSFNPPSHTDSKARADYEEGWRAGGSLRTLNALNEAEAKRAAEEAEAKFAAKVAAFTPEERAAFYAKRRLVIATAIIVCGAWLLSYYGLLSTVLYVMLGIGFAGWLIFIGKGKWVALALLPVTVAVAGRWIWWESHGKSANQLEIKRLIQQQRELDVKTTRMAVDAKRVNDSLSLIYAAKESQRLDEARRSYGH